MSRGAESDPRSGAHALLGALIGAACRELIWGLPAVADELRRWRRRAERIPDEALRLDALGALSEKRTNTDGAALFATLLHERNANVVRLLAAYQALWDYLDSSVERHPTEANGRELHLALAEALEPGGHLSNYYRHHPRSDDGGYLLSLVESCRERCAGLASYELVKDVVIAEARRAEVQALNHLPDREARDDALEHWAARDTAPADGAAWFEVTAAASASLVILPLLALAGRRSLSADEVQPVREGYWPWVTVVTTMLDNYADQSEDAATGNHNYFSHYCASGTGVGRLCDCIAKAFDRIGALPDSERHAVIVGSMIAMYLSKTGDSSLAGRVERLRLARAGGALVCVLVPVLRLWRVAYGISSR